jgi:hypothetical protein
VRLFSIFSIGGSLQASISENAKSGNHFQEPKLKDILLQISLGLKYIHNAGMVHLDIKPSQYASFYSFCHILSFPYHHQNLCLCVYQVSMIGWAWWLMLIIPDTLEEELGEDCDLRPVQGNVSKIPSQSPTQVWWHACDPSYGGGCR